MKRYAVIAISLLAVVGVIAGVVSGIRRGPGMEVRFNKRDFPEHGVHIITPVDSSFDATALKSFKKRIPEALKPFSVFIQNSGDRMVVAYALTWEFAKKDGKIMSNTMGYSEPAILMGDEIPSGFKHTTAIPPDTARCFSWDSQIEDGETQKANSDAVRARLASELSQATDLTVSLEGVVFDDGTFVGSNVTFFQQMEAIINAKVDLLREIALASQQSKVEQALESISAKSREPKIVLGSEFSADEYYRYFRKIYAAEIANKNSAYAKDALVLHLIKSFHRARPVLRKK